MKHITIFTILAAAVGVTAYQTSQSRSVDISARNAVGSNAQLRQHILGDQYNRSGLKARADTLIQRQSRRFLDPNIISRRSPTLQTGRKNQKEYRTRLLRRAGRGSSSASNSRSTSPPKERSAAAQDALIVTRKGSVADRVVAIQSKPHEQSTSRARLLPGKKLVSPTEMQSLRTAPAPSSKPVDQSSSEPRARSQSPSRPPKGNDIPVINDRPSSPARGSVQPQSPSGSMVVDPSFITPKKQPINPDPSRGSRTNDVLAGPPLTPNNVPMTPSNFQTPEKNKQPTGSTSLQRSNSQAKLSGPEWSPDGTPQSPLNYKSP